MGWGPLLAHHQSRSTSHPLPRGMKTQQSPYRLGGGLGLGEGVLTDHRIVLEAALRSEGRSPKHTSSIH